MVRYRWYGLVYGCIWFMVIHPIMESEHHGYLTMEIDWLQSPKGSEARVLTVVPSRTPFVDDVPRERGKAWVFHSVYPRLDHFPRVSPCFFASWTSFSASTSDISSRFTCSKDGPCHGHVKFRKNIGKNQLGKRPQTLWGVGSQCTRYKKQLWNSNSNKSG